MRGRAVRNEVPGSWRSGHVRRSPPDLRVPGHAGAGGMLSGAGGQPGADAAQGSARDGGRRGRGREEGEERRRKKYGKGRGKREGRGRAGQLRPAPPGKRRPRAVSIPRAHIRTWRGAGEVPSVRADRLDVEVPHGQREPRVQPGAPHQAPLGADGLRRLRRPQQRQHGAQQQRQQPAAPHGPAAGPRWPRPLGAGGRGLLRACAAPARSPRQPPPAPRPAGRPAGPGQCRGRGGSSLRAGPGGASAALRNTRCPDPRVPAGLRPWRGGGSGPWVPAQFQGLAPCTSRELGKQSEAGVRARDDPQSPFLGVR